MIITPLTIHVGQPSRKEPSYVIMNLVLKRKLIKSGSKELRIKKATKISILNCIPPWCQNVTVCLCVILLIKRTQYMNVSVCVCLKLVVG